MNVTEAIARANLTFVGTEWENYFSPQQPLAFQETGECMNPAIHRKDDYTEAEADAIAKYALEQVGGVQDEIDANVRATAATTPETRAYVDDVSADAAEKAGVERDHDARLVALYDWCGERGHAIYTEMWPGRESGKSFLLPEDRESVTDGLAAWFKETDDG